MTKTTKRGILQTGLLFSALLVLLAAPASAQAAGTSDTLSAYPVTVEEKVMGDTPDSQNTFVFTLTAVSTGAPLPTNGTELSITGSGSADYTFDLSSARPGDIYEYTVRQQSAGACFLPCGQRRPYNIRCKNNIVSMPFCMASHPHLRETVSWLQG